MARDTDGDIKIGTTLDTTGLDAGLKNINKHLQKMKGLVETVFASSILVKFGKSAIKAASDLQEVQNIINVSFDEEGVARMEKFSKAAVETFGMSEFTAKKTAGAYAAMGSALGLLQTDAEEMAMQLTALSGDMASFWNLTQDETYTALASVYTGETETLKRYGIVLTEANLQQYLYTKGINASIKTMDAASKTMVRYNYIMEQTRLYQDDFIRTQDNWANQIRVLQEHWNRLMIVIGNGLITVLNPLLKVLNTIIEKLITLVKTLGLVLQKVFNIKVQDISQQGVGLADSIADAANAEEDLGNAVSDTNKNLKKSLAAFDEINVLAQDTASTSTRGGSGVTGLESLGLDVVEPYDINAIAKDINEIEPPQKWIDFFTRLKELLEKSVVPLQRLKEQLTVLKDYTFKGLYGFYDNFLKPVGTWVLGEGFPRFVDITANSLQQIKYEKIIQSFNNLWDALAKFSTNIIGEGLLWFYENVLAPITVWATNNILPPAIDILAESIRIITTVLEALQPSAQVIFDYVLKPFGEKIGNLIVIALETIAEKLKDISDWMDAHPLATQAIVTLATALVTIVTTLALIHKWQQMITNTTKLIGVQFTGILKIIQTMATFIGKLGTLSTKLGTIVKFLISPQGLILIGIAAVITAIILIVTHLDEIKAWLSKAHSWLDEHVFTPITNKVDELKEAIKNKIENAKQGVKDKFNSIKEAGLDALQGIKDTFSSVGEWFGEKFETVKTVVYTKFENIKEIAISLWEGIKGVFSNVTGWVTEHIITPVTSKMKNFFQGILDFGIGVINKLIDGINALITKISESKVADVIGSVIGKDLSESIPTIKHVKIPQLAKGAVIPPNKAFMAVLGDQTQGTNIEAPADLIRSIVREEIANQNSNQNQNITIEFKGTMAQFVRALNPEIKREQRRTGTNLISGGAI